MVRDIEEDTVDFQDNYDGQTQEPVVLPARFPNLLVNGSVGIAVGMATNIPPHNLREVSSGALWALENPDATREELLEALMERIPGPDFPTHAQILGTRGIKDAYRTGRGSITMRAVVNVEEIQGRTCLVITELPYQVNPDNVAVKISDLAREGKITGIADIRDETSDRTGQRLVIVLKRDAVAKVVLNNLYKHTQLQENFGANMLAIVDGVPRTLPLDGFITHWIDHQIEVIVRRTRFRLRKAEERMHILRGYLKALDALDEVIALIRRSPTVDDARDGPEGAARDRRHPGRRDPRDAAAPPRGARASEDHRRGDRARGADRRLQGDPRRPGAPAHDHPRRAHRRSSTASATTAAPQILPGYDGDMSIEDLIPEEEMVVTVTRDGYIKRTRSDNYRSAAPRRQGRQGRAAARRRRRRALLRHHDAPLAAVLHDQGPRLPLEGLRGARGRPRREGPARREPARAAARRGDRADPRHPRLQRRDLPRARHPRRPREEDAPHRVRHEPPGRRHRDQARAKDDEVTSALLVEEGDDILLISRHGMSLRFTATDESLRPMGRSTEGVKGMSFRDDDSLLSASVAQDEGIRVRGHRGRLRQAHRVDQYRGQSRGGLGIKVARLSDDRGVLAGGLIVGEDDEVLVVLASGKVVRSAVAEVPAKGRDTMGVVFARADDDDRIIAIARNGERGLAESSRGSRHRAARCRVGTPEASPEIPEESTDA